MSSATVLYNTAQNLHLIFEQLRSILTMQTIFKDGEAQGFLKLNEAIRDNLSVFQ